MCAIDQVLQRIEFLRNKMTSVAMEKGLNDFESIAISQELDRLLNLYEDMKQKN
ncbi:aspartyl-phosphate phosphatase Spo0E family protein [Virgibacillus sp. YIM 98842]|uniref:aspartyl-phosphate phosphatase Spo0E family protein n=1 Tax=Virgibacillus sp. YIM 98842 TaxID=2663533 RepID=UPI0013DAF6E5|nr:aspartyl-phosphate phosphatase Spo0E family protein [Virgibacillus sp. YIM 98842]